MPALGTFLYRLGTIPPERGHAFLAWLAEQGIAIKRQQRAEQAEALREATLTVVDGTGVGDAGAVEGGSC